MSSKLNCMKKLLIPPPQKKSSFWNQKSYTNAQTSVYIYILLSDMSDKMLFNVEIRLL